MEPKCEGKKRIFRKKKKGKDAFWQKFEEEGEEKALHVANYNLNPYLGIIFIYLYIYIFLYSPITTK